MVLQVFGKGLGYTGAGIVLAVISPIAIAGVISTAVVAPVAAIPYGMYICGKMVAASLIAQLDNEEDNAGRDAIDIVAMQARIDEESQTAHCEFVDRLGHRWRCSGADRSASEWHLY